MKDKFYYNPSKETFIGRIQFLSKNIELEIKKKEFDIDWKQAENFVLSLDDEHLPKIIDISSQLLLEFIRLVPFGISEPISAYEFRLEGIVYYGKVDNFIFSDLVDGFELLFKLYHSNYAECEDPQGNYMIRIDNRLITGVRREQI